MIAGEVNIAAGVDHEPQWAGESDLRGRPVRRGPCLRIDREFVNAATVEGQRRTAVVDECRAIAAAVGTIVSADAVEGNGGVQRTSVDGRAKIDDRR